MFRALIPPTMSRSFSAIGRFMISCCGRRCSYMETPVKKKGKVYEVPTDPKTLSQLVERLQPGLPRTNSIRMCVRNIKDGRINAKLYADGWPEFSTLVCQIFYPTTSEEADIVPYFECKEGLVHVLKEAELISWGKQQMIAYVDEHDGDYLIEKLKPPEEGIPGLETSSFYHGSVFYIPGELQGPDVSCPVGYVLGTLESRHAQFIASRWSVKNERSSLYMEALIKTSETCAVFHDQDRTNPVAWNLQHSSGEIGHTYIVKEHRRKELATILGREMCKKIIARGDLPLTITSYDNPIYGLAKKLGFVELFKTRTIHYRT